MIDAENLDFHPSYVNPYYGGLMGFNFMNKALVANPVEFLQSLQGLRKELSNEDILSLLNANWRPSKVGAWLIGLCKIQALETALMEYLKSRPSHCEHVLINLTLFNSAEGRTAIQVFVQQQLEIVLDQTENGQAFQAFNLFESNSLVWGFNAIRYLDSINHTVNFETLLKSVLWTDLKTAWLKFSQSNPRAVGFYEQLLASEKEDLGFEEAFELITKSRSSKR